MTLRYASSSNAEARVFIDADSCDPETDSKHAVGAAVMPDNGGNLSSFSRTVPLAVSTVHPSDVETHFGECFFLIATRKAVPGTPFFGNGLFCFFPCKNLQTKLATDCVFFSFRVCILISAFVFVSKIRPARKSGVLHRPNRPPDRANTALFQQFAEKVKKSLLISALISE